MFAGFIQLLKSTTEYAVLGPEGIGIGPNLRVHKKHWNKILPIDKYLRMRYHFREF